MVATARIPLPRRPDLLIRPLGGTGKVVVKDPRTGAYFNLGPEEAFLLDRLDGSLSREGICDAFEDHFGGSLDDEDLDDFLTLASSKGMLRPSETTTESPSTLPRPKTQQSLLSFRKNLFDPDRFFTWLEPKITFFWTRGFVVASAACILAAAWTVWANREELATPLVEAAGWRLLALGGLTLLLVTTLHEFAHGLTCKHHGGEVHEVGFLLLFFMPGMFCNVSDSWLIPEKSKRLWVTLAGGYFELCLWSLAVFAWRLTAPETLPNYLAWTVVSVSRARALFNFNPLMKLDGYYFLSDLVEVPNLRQRSFDAWLGRLRWLFWGGSRPEAQRLSAFLFALGMVSWCFSVGMVALMALGISRLLVPQAGWISIGVILLFAWLTMRGLLRGLSEGEIGNMIHRRRRRAVLWGLLLAATPGVLCLYSMEDRASGPFKLRPGRKIELRAATAGFIRMVAADEGDHVSPGQVVVCLEVPDLETKIAQKKAEADRTRADFRLVEIGSRPEEVAEQRSRVERAVLWRDRARADLERAEGAHRHDRESLRQQVARSRSEAFAARATAQQTHNLHVRGFVSMTEEIQSRKNLDVADTTLRQSEAKLHATEIQGTLPAETELARREKDLADARAVLTLQEAGSRREELESARARFAQAQEELSYLASLDRKLRLMPAEAGVITTARLREKIGQYVNEGDLIAEIRGEHLEAEILLDEQSAGRVRSGQPVGLRARAATFETFTAKVDRVAPTAAKAEGETKTTVTVYCRLDAPTEDLKPEMTGHAQIARGSRPVGEILAERILSFLRTEFWL